jgi:hypothetical protein
LPQAYGAGHGAVPAAGCSKLQTTNTLKLPRYNNREVTSGINME